MAFDTPSSLQWCEAQAEGVGTLWDGVLSKYSWAAGTVAQAHHGTVEIQPYAVFLLQFVVVGGVVELLHTVGKGGETKAHPCPSRREGFYEPAVTVVVGDFQPLHIVVVARILRTGVMHVLLANGTLIDIDQSGGVAVGIIVPRAAAQVLYILQLLG